MPPQLGSERSLGRWSDALDWRHQSRETLEP
jgi:hypothetical protein